MWCTLDSIFCILLLISLFNLIISEKDDDSYAVIVDAGSTGSRGYIFTFTTNEEGKKYIISQKGPKVEPGLSSTETHEEILVAYFLPIFIEASKLIPEHSYIRTSAYIKGTAGMRLLSDDDQSKLWQAVYHGLSSHPDFKFHLDLSNLGTIDGHMEAYYAVLAANYIEGSINAELVPQPGIEMVGALDMGGSSTQLICHTGNNIKPGEPVKQSDFWSHSWLNFGVERMRDRVWELIVQEHLVATGSQTEVEVNISGEVSPTVVMNPCTFPGYEMLWNDTYLMQGTGDSTRCVQLIKQVLWPDDSSSDKTDSTDSDTDTQNDGHTDSDTITSSHSELSRGRYVDDIHHPPLKGYFYGMSVYFYALDCVRQLGPVQLVDWPSPRIDDLEAAAHAFCALDWSYVQTSLMDQHKYTKNTQLANRCIESLYIVTLLEHGFGFDGQSRNVTIALDVKGMEVEWTLGYALAEIQPALIQKEQRALQLGHTKNSAWKTGQVNVIAAWMSRIKSLLKYISRAMKFLNIYLAIFS